MLKGFWWSSSSCSSKI